MSNFLIEKSKKIGSNIEPIHLRRIFLGKTLWCKWLQFAGIFWLRTTKCRNLFSFKSSQLRRILLRLSTSSNVFWINPRENKPISDDELWETKLASKNLDFSNVSQRMTLIASFETSSTHKTVWKSLDESQNTTATSWFDRIHSFLINWKASSLSKQLRTSKFIPPNFSDTKKKSSALPKINNLSIIHNWFTT